MGEADVKISHEKERKENMYGMLAQAKNRFRCTRTIYTAAVGALAFFGLLTSASATPFGNLAIDGCAGGGVDVNATSITWLGTPGGMAKPGYGCIDTTNGGAGTNVTFSGGTLGPGVTGEIKDLTLGVTPGTDFMDFTGASSLIFNLSNFSPGPSNTNCATLSLFQTCAVVPGSFFVLELVPGGTGSCPAGISGNCQTGVTLVANGTVSDATGTSNWSGSFTTQIATLSPAQIQATILAGGTIGSSESGAFTITTIPEPLSFSMIGLGLVALAIVGRKKLRV